MKTILLNLVLLLLLNLSFGAYANQQIADVMASISARSLFDLDNEEMKSIFSPLLEKNSFIKGLRVIDSLENEVFLEFYNKDGMQIFDQFIPLQFTEFKSFESQIKFNDETIGSIIIYTKSEHNSFDLTNKEKAWLNNNPIQRVAVMSHWPHDSKNNSLHTELLKLINKHIGTNLVPIFFDSWKKGYKE